MITTTPPSYWPIHTPVTITVPVWVAGTKPSTVSGSASTTSKATSWTWAGKSGSGSGPWAATKSETSSIGVYTVTVKPLASATGASPVVGTWGSGSTVNSTKPWTATYTGGATGRISISIGMSVFAFVAAGMALLL